ncbi:MAG: GGDEF domain-containing protein [Proteobacteria bacterium]|nr:GGDEF domain-containing protein [Pseudomonadota bacterium]MBU1387350.1 GGDEF domain-containing protein [Pseudomonadota bacterium]MBU1541635.1 GGDEF domain-containing protein [Pseudomonadota bacterium]
MDSDIEDRSENIRAPEFESRIYECLDNGFKFNQFPHDLEQMYLNYHHKARTKRFIWFGLIGLFFYNLFLIGDKTMLPDIFHEALITRVFVVTPLMIFSIIGMSIKKLSRFVDFLAGNIIFLASASILYFLLITNNPNVSNYHTGLIILIVVGNIVMRIRFRYAVFFTLLILFFFILTVSHIELMNQETVNNSIMVLFTIVCFTLIGNYQIEHENRLMYLNSLLRRIDAIKLEDSNKKLQQMSITDGLTGLINRRHFDVAIKNEWKNCCRSNTWLSLIFIDIDCFKNYNDNYGHQKGDDCLQQVAGQLKATVNRPRDIAARYGGEEFVIILPETDAQGAMTLAGKIGLSIEGLNIPHKFSMVADVVTVSIGVATMQPSGGGNLAQLIGLADTALYEAKNQGRNKTILHPESHRIV